MYANVNLAGRDSIDGFVTGTKKAFGTDRPLVCIRSSSAHDTIDRAQFPREKYIIPPPATPRDEHEEPK